MENFNFFKAIDSLVHSRVSSLSPGLCGLHEFTHFWCNIWKSVFKLFNTNFTELSKLFIYLSCYLLQYKEEMISSFIPVFVHCSGFIVIPWKMICVKLQNQTSSRISAWILALPLQASWPGGDSKTCLNPVHI